jgi:hypothetical protein
MYMIWILIQTAEFSVYLTRHTDFDCGLFRLPKHDTLILTTIFCVLNGPYNRCDRLAEGAYSP